jgi:hypothetical protein
MADELTIGTYQIGWTGLSAHLDAVERKPVANAGNQYSISWPFRPQPYYWFN